MQYKASYTLLLCLIYTLHFVAIIFLVERDNNQTPNNIRMSKELVDIGNVAAKWGNVTVASTGNGTLNDGNITTPSNRCDITIIVLTMKRHKSVTRLLLSIAASDYGSDCICMEIHIDFHKENTKTVKVAKLFKEKFSPLFCGGILVKVGTQNIGLREAWFKAWYPASDGDYAIILEDDVELAPVWYKWLKAAWSIYHNRTDVAGISLCRQQLIPKQPYKRREIVNEHMPFLYKLVGSYGFSPHPRHWKAFLDWISHTNVDKRDMHVPGLITTEWWKSSDRRHIWTQCFIYFCDKYNLYTLYVNLPHKETLVAHWQEKGEHYRTSLGRDFTLARQVNVSFPDNPVKYGWDGLSNNK